MLRKRNKKAMGIEDVGMLVYRVIFLTLTAFVFVLFMNLLLTPVSFSDKAESEMLLARVIYSEAIHYKNPETERIYTNIIDFDKLYALKNEDKLEDYLREEFYHESRENLLVFNLTLNFVNPTNSQDITKNFVSNSDQYMLLEPKKSFEGEGAVIAAQRKFTTKCLVESNIIPCKIDLIVLMPKS